MNRTVGARDRRRGGYTLIELVSSLLTASILMAGLGTSMYVAMKATDPTLGLSEELDESSQSLAQLNGELRFATAIGTATATAIEFTVPDITGDMVDDVIRWQWSGTAGDPVERILNGGAPESVADDVHDFNLVYHTGLSSSGDGESPVYQEFSEAKLASDGTAIAVPKPSATGSGDLFIAAVAVDGNVLSSLSGPGGWSLLEKTKNGSTITMGVWWKQASGSEPADYTFTWSGGQEAYAWIMRFTGHDTGSPIQTHSAGNQAGRVEPESPAVTTTSDNTLVLRLGAFDDDDIFVDAPGLPGHTAITMDKSNTGLQSASGGAGYILQPTAGDSGLSNFVLAVSEQSAKVTLAIAPPGGSPTTVYKLVDVRAQVGANTASVVHTSVQTLNEPEVVP